jgi:hypothetical protein
MSTVSKTFPTYTLEELLQAASSDPDFAKLPCVVQISKLCRDTAQKTIFIAAGWLAGVLAIGQDNFDPLIKALLGCRFALYRRDDQPCPTFVSQRL